MQGDPLGTSHRPEHQPRQRAAALLAGSVAAAAGCAWLAWHLGLLLPSAVRATDRGPAGPLLAAATGLAVAVLVRLCLTALACAACGLLALVPVGQSAGRDSTGRGGGRQLCARIAVMVSPRAARPALAAVLAGALALGTAASANAAAAGAASASAASSSAASVSAAPASTAPASTMSARTASASTEAGTSHDADPGGADPSGTDLGDADRSDANPSDANTSHPNPDDRATTPDVDPHPAELPAPGWSSGADAPAARESLPAPTWTPERPAPPRRQAADVSLVAAAPSRHGEPLPVVVRRGDTLWSIATRHLGAGATTADVAHEWPRWWRANRATIGADPDLLLPGQVLVPPAPGSAR